MEYWSLAISIGLVCFGLFLLVLFGLRNLTQGKHSMFAMLALLIPVIVFGICYALFSDGDPSKAALLTCFTMLGIGLAGLLLSGVKGLVG